MINKNKTGGIFEGVRDKEFFLLLFAITFLGLVSLSKVNFDEAIITGKAVLEQNNTTSEFVYVPPAEITKESALDALIKAEEDIKEVAKLNLTTYFLNDIMLKAKRSYIGSNTDEIKKRIEDEKDILKRIFLGELLKVVEDTPIHEIERLDYNEVFKLTQLIAFKKQQISNIIGSIPLVEEKEKSYSKRNINTSEAIILIEEAKSSLKGERYDEAEVYLKEADLKLEKASSEYQRVKGIALLGKNFFLRYWWQIILITTLISVAIYPATKKYLKVKRLKKIESLKIELSNTDKLIKKWQEDCYNTKIMDEDTFRIRRDQIRKRATEIKSEIPVLEALVYGEKDNLDKGKDKIEEEPSEKSRSMFDIILKGKRG